MVWFEGSCITFTFIVSQGDSEVASVVITESEIQGEEAKQFLEDVRVNFPQVLRVLKTRQVTYSVLNHLIDYVQNLEKVGLLDKKEMVHLHNAVQYDLKKLLRNPPLVKIPEAGELISINPLLGALPPTSREILVESAKYTTKLHGSTLYKEGANPNGIWIISNGVVKESATVLIKILVPQIFEKLPMQEVRALVAEKSTMSTYLSGESFEIPPHFIGLLLEGYIRGQRIQEPIASPAVLLPWYGDTSFRGSEISGIELANFLHHASCYQVETGARVIMFNIATIEANRPLQEMLSSSV